MKNILSIDGGGVRTYIPLRILNEIEKRTCMNISELFDYFTGVSAGSLITNLLLLKNENGKQKYNTSEILDIFIKECKNIFSYSYYDLLKTGFGFINPLYSTNNILKTINNYFEDKKFIDLLKPSCIISYDILSSKPYYFNTLEYNNLNIKDFILASASAPTYFYPYKTIINDSEHLFIDGGIVTNNPAEICFLKACEYYDEDEFFTLSLGTGYNDIDIKSYGTYSWAKNILNIIFSANSEFQSNEITFIDKIMKKNKYSRVNILMKEYIYLDDVNSFDKLDMLMNTWIKNNDEMLNDLCNQLKDNLNK